MAKAGFLSIGDVFEQGNCLWARRDYLRALGCFLRTIQRSEREDWLGRIAALTGETLEVKILAEGRNPVLSPEGDRVAFISQDGNAWKVFFVSCEGTNLQRLEYTGSCDKIQLQFSPDGKQLVFVSTCDGKSRIYSASLENKRVTQLEENEGDIQNLVFSPDGKRIAFSNYNPESATSYLLDLESKTKVELKSRRKFNFSPVFLPPGEKIIFVAGEPGPEGLSLVIEDIKKGTQAALDLGGMLFPPLCCSPDGKHAAFSGPQGLCVFDLDDKVSKRADPAGGETKYWSLSFSQDSRTLLFISRENDKDAVRLLNIDTMQTRTISSSRALIDWARFLPDGKMIICAYNHGRFTHKLSLINSNGGGFTPLDNDLPCADRTIVGYRDVSFSCDGKRMAYGRDHNGDYRDPDQVCLIDMQPLKPIDKQALTVRVKNLISQEHIALKRAELMFKATDKLIKELTGQVSRDNLREYIRILEDFGPRFAGSAACDKAADFLCAKFAGWGLEVTPDDFRHQQQENTLNLRNVIATLPGKTNAGIIYINSAHYDSYRGSPGAWDDASGTAVVLETARILSALNLGATVKFACFSAEELSMAGSKHFVRKIKEAGLDIRGVVHNDCVGYQRGDKKEVTLFYASAHIRDLLHSAAMAYADLSSYSSASPINSDDRSFANALGNITVSIQDYPYLPSPYMHAAGDVGERLSLSLVAEVTMLNVAALAALATCPCPVKGIRIERPEKNRLFVAWQKNDENDVCGYRVYHGLYPDIFNRAADAGEAEHYYLEGVPEEIPYYITVKAYDKHGRESWGAEEININGRGMI